MNVEEKEVGGGGRVAQATLLYTLGDKEDRWMSVIGKQVHFMVLG